MISSQARDKRKRCARPLVIDLYSGLGGWAEGFLAENYEVIGFDIERHDYGTGTYPGQLVLQDVLTLHGSQFRDAAVIVASPPCQAYSYRAMPWKRAKALPPPDNSLFEACFRIQREASEAAGRHIPMVVENVKGAQPWVGRARWHYGSYFLWGDVPALMPSPSRSVGVKVAGLNWSGSDEPGYKAQAFNSTAEKRLNGRKVNNHIAENSPPGVGKTSWFHGNTKHELRDGVKVALSGRAWFTEGLGKVSSRSSARKAASAQIAKIPFELSRHIASWYRPEDTCRAV